MSKVQYSPIFDMSELGCIISHHGGIKRVTPPNSEQPHWNIELMDDYKIYTTLPFGVIAHLEKEEITWRCSDNVLPLQGGSGVPYK